MLILRRWLAVERPRRLPPRALRPSPRPRLHSPRHQPLARELRSNRTECCPLPLRFSAPSFFMPNDHRRAPVVLSFARRGDSYPGFMHGCLGAPSPSHGGGSHLTAPRSTSSITAYRTASMLWSLPSGISSTQVPSLSRRYSLSRNSSYAKAHENKPMQGSATAGSRSGNQATSGAAPDAGGSTPAGSASAQGRFGHRG